MGVSPTRQPLQPEATGEALHAKAKAEAGCRFYALYDKISREDILAHAYAQCCSNKGAPGVDGDAISPSGDAAPSSVHSRPADRP